MAGSTPLKAPDSGRTRNFEIDVVNVQVQATRTGREAIDERVVN